MRKKKKNLVKNILAWLISSLHHGILAILLLLFVCCLSAQTRYDAVMEWNGPFFHVINNPFFSQVTTDLIEDYPFSSPHGIFAVNTNDDSLTHIFVIDEDNNRIQLFESQIRYRTIASNEWKFSSAGTFTNGDATATSNILYVPETRNNTTLGSTVRAPRARISKGSVIVKVDGIKMTEVEYNALSSFTADDSVFAIDYTNNATFPAIYFLSGTFTNEAVSTKPDQKIEVYYAYYFNEYKTKLPTSTAMEEGWGDIDYGATFPGFLGRANR